MYIARKQFLYWHIPATTRVYLNTQPHRQAAYCFVPAKLVTKVAAPKSRIFPRLLSESAKCLAVRGIIRVS